MTRKFITIWKLCIDSIHEATTTPRLVTATPIRNPRNSISTMIGIDSEMPTSGPIQTRMATCTRASVAPPKLLPTATAQRGTGATSTSFRNPNSRSQMIEIAEKIDVNRMLMPITPGYMNLM